MNFHVWRRTQREQDLEREVRSDLELEAVEQQESVGTPNRPGVRRGSIQW